MWSPAGRLAAVLALAVVGVAGALYLAAYLSTSSSGLARAIVWRDADVDDYKRFPARSIEAPAEPRPFRRGRLPRMPRREDIARLLESSETTAFLIVRGDELLHERYLNGARRDSVQTSFSVAKSFLSALVGIAIAEGHIGSVDDPVTRYVPELRHRDERFDRIRLRDLLTMSSGLRYDEGGLPWSDDAETYYSTDLRRLAIDDTDVEEAPGVRFHYNNYNPLLLGLVLERATGVPVARYLERKLWRPLGMEFDASWSLDSEGSGFEKMESGLNARPVDYAKFARLYLTGGTANGRQLIPRSWIAASTSPAAGGASPSYGFFWWLRGRDFYARGNQGQFLYLAPELDVAVLRFGRGDGGVDWPRELARIARASAR